jgi:hypothetical protein
MLLPPLMLVVSLQSTDPALEVIAQAYQASRQPFLIINEDHSVDYHRHVSACLLERVASDASVILGAEAIRPGPLPVSEVGAYISSAAGYSGTSGFRDIWDIVSRHDISAFGYDPRREDFLSDQQLLDRGLQSRVPNRRDSVSADRIIDFQRSNPESGIYLHVGHAHASERWSLNDTGHGTGWLAAHLAVRTGFDPVTVQQLGPDRFAYYELYFQDIADPQACATPYDQTYLLRLNTGVVGCIHRSRLSEGHASDFIILHDITGADRNPITPQLCDTRP